MQSTTNLSTEMPAAFFTGNFPASTLVQVAALADPSLKVEIEAVAHIGAGSP